MIPNHHMQANSSCHTHALCTLYVGLNVPPWDTAPRRWCVQSRVLRCCPSVGGTAQPCSWWAGLHQRCSSNEESQLELERTHTMMTFEATAPKEWLATWRFKRRHAPTRVAVVLDHASEALLVAVELKGCQTLIFQSLPGDNVDGWLGSSRTVAVGAVPIVRR